MADGDAAAAAGMDVVPGISDLRLGYIEVNKTRDYLAGHMTDGTHVMAQVIGLEPALAGKATTAAAAAAQSTASTAQATADAALAAAANAEANGPTATAYNRSATGTGWVTVWMNSALQFMRNTSSRRYKKNIRDWTGTTLGLRTVIFDRKGDDTPDDEVGFIAEEVHEVLPEAVVYFDGKIDGINDRVILAALVADVQRLTALVERSAE